ncbi:hypothetical protein GCM10009745_09390 [Kribbella yunnanensis]|uniref:Uncharacterized protein n=1 Tax=Kribbella yunnanensis TaxID=190194 RepID=A0ABN2GCK4_9ACTN
MAATAGRTLDLWAVALGAGNDAESLRALSKLLVATITAQQTCARLVDATADLTDCGASDALAAARDELAHIEEAMLSAVGGFRAHARGRG